MLGRREGAGVHGRRILEVRLPVGEALVVGLGPRQEKPWSGTLGRRSPVGVLVLTVGAVLESVAGGLRQTGWCVGCLGVPSCL